MSVQRNRGCTRRRRGVLELPVRSPPVQSSSADDTFRTLAHLIGRKSPREDFERKQRPAPRRQMTTPKKEHNQPLKITRF